MSAPEVEKESTDIIREISRDRGVREISRDRGVNGTENRGR